MSLLSAGLLAFSLLLAPPQDEVVQDAQTANREPAQTAQKTTDDSTPTIEQPEADGDTEDTKADPVEPDEADKSDNELNEESLNGSVPATMPSLPATEGNPDERMDQGVSADPPTVEATRRETTAVDAGNTADSLITKYNTAKKVRKRIKTAVPSPTVYASSCEEPAWDRDRIDLYRRAHW